MTEYYTPNFRIRIPNFNERSWHDDYRDGFVTLDAFLAKYIIANNIRGPWQKDMAYAVDDIAVDSDLGTLWRCIVAHVSGVGTFQGDRTAHPDYWEAFSIPMKYAGAWQPNFSYTVGDFSAYGTKYMIANTSHTSNPTFDATEEAKWDVLIDLSLASAPLPPAAPGIATQYLRVKADGTAYETRTAVQTVTDIGAVPQTQMASTTVFGIAKLATNAQVITGTDDFTIVTPLRLSERINAIPPVPPATDMVPGITEKATQAEVNAGTDTDRYITPAALRGLNGFITGPLGIGAAAPISLLDANVATGNAILNVRTGNASYAAINLKNSVNEWQLANHSAGSFIFSDVTASKDKFVITTGNDTRINMGASGSLWTTLGLINSTHRWLWQVESGTGNLLLYDETNSAQRMSVDGTAGGFIMGNATGGYKGVGTVNATGLFINGVAVSAGGGIPDAPADSTYYTRRNNTWIAQPTAVAGTAGLIALATQAEVNAGTVTNKANTPETLRGFNGWVTGPLGVGLAPQCLLDARATTGDVALGTGTGGANNASLWLRNSSREWILKNTGGAPASGGGTFQVYDVTAAAVDLAINVSGQTIVGRGTWTASGDPNFPLAVISGQATYSYMGVLAAGVAGIMLDTSSGTHRRYDIAVANDGMFKIIDQGSGGGVMRMCMDPAGATAFGNTTPNYWLHVYAPAAFDAIACMQATAAGKFAETRYINSDRIWGARVISSPNVGAFEIIDYGGAQRRMAMLVDGINDGTTVFYHSTQSFVRVQSGAATQARLEFQNTVRKWCWYLESTGALIAYDLTGGVECARIDTAGKFWCRGGAANIGTL